MKTIPLTRGMTVVVDDSDYCRVNGYRWYALHCMDRFYAARKARAHESGNVVLMHRFLVDAPDGTSVDHRDGDSLNNRQDNLRLATHAQNMANRRLQKNNTTGFRGVQCRGDRFAAYVRANGKRQHLGCFDSAEEAARARDEAAIRAYGAFAQLNFPPNDASGHGSREVA